MQRYEFEDDLGPVKVIHVHEAAIGLRGVLVVDNVATGPSIGGLRMAPDVTVEECFRLARSMTMKNAAAGLAHGGGKSVMVGDPAMPKAEKECLIRAFACALAREDMYIFGPDMGTNEECMAWVHDEIGRAVGLPREIGGIPLDEIGATGFGVALAAEVAAAHIGLDLKGARVVIQGFGAVGKFAARFLGERGCVLIGAADSRGAIHDPGGLDVEALIAHKEKGGHLDDLRGGRKLDAGAVVELPCDILVPAARPDVISEANVDRVDTKLVVSGANIPATAAAERALHARGIMSIPDFIANAGGVICAAVEHHGGTQSIAMHTIEEKIRANTQAVLDMIEERKCTPREAAVALAETRVRRAMSMRRWSSF